LFSEKGKGARKLAGERRGPNWGQQGQGKKCGLGERSRVYSRRGVALGGRCCSIAQRGKIRKPKSNVATSQKITYDCGGVLVNVGGG